VNYIHDAQRNAYMFASIGSLILVWR